MLASVYPGNFHQSDLRIERVRCLLPLRDLRAGPWGLQVNFRAFHRRLVQQTYRCQFFQACQFFLLIFQCVE